MTQWIFNSMWGWLGVAGVTVVACLAVAWFIPPFRKLALMIAGIAASAATIYSKGSRDRAILEQRRKDEAVARRQEQDAAIDSRPDTPDTVSDRLRRHDF